MKEYNIPLLEAADIECRVQSVKKKANGEVGAVVLIYKDARVDMRILDLVFGVGNWQRTHKLIGDNLYCNIDIWDEDKNCWIRKQDVGTESNTEKEKGQASDSFKRAGFNVGIGRELYTAPFIYIALKDKEYYEDKGKLKSSAAFTVTHIGYNSRREITELTIADRYGNERFSMKPSAQKPAQMQIPQPQKDVFCSICGEKIKPVRKQDGTVASPEEVAKVTEGLCTSCYKLVQARDAG